MSKMFSSKSAPGYNPLSTVFEAKFLSIFRTVKPKRQDTKNTVVWQAWDNSYRHSSFKKGKMEEKNGHWFIAVLKSSWANVKSSFVKFWGLEITLVWRIPSLMISILYIIRFYPPRSCSLFFSRKVTRVYSRIVISVCFLLLDLEIWPAAFVLYSLSIVVQVNSILLK